MTTINPKTLENGEIHALLASINDGLFSAANPFHPQPDYIATMQPIYDALLAEWRVRYPVENEGVIIG